jgi:hypothetical protein
MALACKGRHEEQAQRLSLVQMRAWRAGSSLPFFAIAMGLLFVTWGVLSKPFSLLTALLGFAFLALAFVFVALGKTSSR